MRCFRGGLTLGVHKIPFRVFSSLCGLAGDFLDQIVKTARINPPALLRGLDQIHFCDLQLRKAGQRAIDWVRIKTRHRQSQLNFLFSGVIALAGALSCKRRPFSD
jgi:hypothetical protein